MGSWMDDRGLDGGRAAGEPDSDSPVRRAAWSDADERRAVSPWLAGAGLASTHAPTQDLLAQALQCEIIPRLMKSQAHLPGEEAPAMARAVLSHADVHDFSRCVLDQDLSFAQARLEALQARGLSHEDLYLELLTPAARLMGLWWEEDAITFSDVTVGLGRLQQLLREFSARHDSERPLAGRRVLLLAAPGEQHTFGLTMVAEFFARAGWDVCGDPVDGGSNALRRVREEWFDVVGFTLGTVEQAAELGELVAQIRTHSRNAQVGIIAGGPAFLRQPQCAVQVGADVTAVDGPQAVALAERLVGREGLVS